MGFLVNVTFKFRSWMITFSKHNIYCSYSRYPFQVFLDEKDTSRRPNNSQPHFTLFFLWSNVGKKSEKYNVILINYNRKVIKRFITCLTKISKHVLFIKCCHHKCIKLSCKHMITILIKSFTIWFLFLHK